MNSADPDTPLTDPDREVLAFLAAHPLVLRAQVHALLGVDADAANARLDALAAQQLVNHVRVGRRAGYHQITRLGLAAIGSELPPPSVNLARCRHDIGLAWTALAAQRGAFGRVADVLTERQQRAHDSDHTTVLTLGEREEPPYGIPMLDAGSSLTTTVHHPDLLLISDRGERIAIELILTPNGQHHREQSMASYRTDRTLAAVMYLVEDPRTLEMIRRTADRLGIASLVHVRLAAAPAPRTDGAD